MLHVLALQAVAQALRVIQAIQAIQVTQAQQLILQDKRYIEKLEKSFRL